MHEGDASRLHLRNRGGGVFFSKEGNHARVGGDDAGQDVHQRGFAGAVFAKQGMDLALFHGEMNVIKDLVRTKGLGNVFHFKDRHR